MDPQIKNFLESKGFEFINQSDGIFIFLKKMDGKFIEVAILMDTEFRIVAGSSIAGFPLENTIKVDCKGSQVSINAISVAFDRVVLDMAHNLSLHYNNIKEMKDTFK